MGRRKPLLLNLFLITVLTTVIMSYGIIAHAARKESCITSKCHSDFGKDKYVHGPVATGDCTTCHQQEGKHKFKTIKQVSAVCYQCHEENNTMKNVHPPVKEGDCTGCHSPHQSPNKFQLIKEPKKLCFVCHDEALIERKFVHGPVAVGGCSVCHNPHQSDFPKMLIATGNDVCFACHTDKADAFKQKKFVHQPVKDDCIGCHSPHSGDYEFNLEADGSRDLCFGCHDDKEEWLANVKVKHGGLDTPKRCLTCHDPHVSAFVKQLRKQPVDLCLSCHDKKLESSKIINMREYLADNKDHHGPIRQKDCSACHNTHGSNNFRMLREYFPPVFYSPFDPKNYSLCFTCHEETLVTTEKTDTLTGFRNGDQNLHFVHVNKKVKGRTCRACHDAHATNNPKHIRDAVPFGVWDLPIQHEISDRGGTCSPGCHQTFSYDRGEPVKNR
jgi:predicted CXXCH cytochrome family protein